MSGSGDYISRSAAIKRFTFATLDCLGMEPTIRASDVVLALQSIPAADVRPVVRGKWVDMGDFISCSSCNATHLKEFESDYGKVMRLDVRTKFCPNCGADMREES